MRTRTAAIDGLRGLAAVSVLVFHVWLFSQPEPSFHRRDGAADHVLGELRLGLFLFFVLSGFLLYGPWVRREPLGLAEYLRRRAARILPAYYVALLGAVALLWGAEGTPGVRLPDASDLWRFAVFGQNYARDTLLTLNPPTWTLAVEVAFYLALPLFGALALRLPRGRLAQSAVPLGLLAAGLAWNAAIGAGASPLLTFALPAMLPYFACGMLLAVLVEGRSVRRAHALLAAGAALVVADVVWHQTTEAGVRVLRDVPAAAGFALVLAAALAAAAPARVLASRPAVALGTVSYAVYLWHVPLILALRAAGALPEHAAAALLVVLPLTLAVAAASWVLVERPALRRRGGRSAYASGVAGGA